MAVEPSRCSGPTDLPSHLFDPSISAPDVDLTDLPEIDWRGALSMMARIRVLEDLVGRKSEEGLFKTPVHLSIGQEAVPVGVAFSLRPGDYAFGNHRSHGHYLAMGGSSYDLLCEILGKEAGCSHGMGGSMHITAPSFGFVGSVPIVAGTIPIAVGAGLFAKHHTKDAIAVAFFGDGAVEEGVFHESMNFAATHGIPVLFLCENNIFSSHMHLTQRQPAASIARFAHANCIESRTVDGNDVAEVHRAARSLVHTSRTERKPTCLEVVTYRWRAHVGPPDDLEIGLYRSVDLPRWRERDPIRRLARPLVCSGLIDDTWTDTEFERIDEELAQQWDRALQQADPAPERLLSWVYTGGRA